MKNSKLLKTPTLGIALQVIEITESSKDERSWLVHDVERNRSFRLILPKAVSGSSADRPRRPPTEEELDEALGLAVERSLVSPPEKVPGPTYDVTVTTQDLRPSSKKS